MPTTHKQVHDGGKLTTVPLPEAAAKALDLRNHPEWQSEFCRMGDLRKMFGIVRSTAYVLSNEGHIKTCSLRRKGQARSIRLVSVASVRAYLNRLLAEQNSETKVTEEQS